MSSNPKIVVVKTREIIYTLLLLFLVALLIVCLVLMFAPKSDNPSGTGQNAADTQMQTGQSQAESQTAQSSSSGAQPQTGQTQPNTQQQNPQTQTGAPAAQTAAAPASYVPGVYTTPVTLGEASVDVEVTVDSSHINSIRLVNLSETTAAAYPLVSPSLDHIASQILMTQDLEGITCPQENKYTSQLLLSAISDALDRASVQ